MFDSHSSRVNCIYLCLLLVYLISIKTKKRYFGEQKILTYFFSLQLFIKEQLPTLQVRDLFIHSNHAQLRNGK